MLNPTNSPLYNAVDSGVQPHSNVFYFSTTSLLDIKPSLELEFAIIAIKFTEAS